MKQFFLSITFIFISICYLTGQHTTILKFDGVNDYVDVGNQAGNNLRTLELWFQPIQNIDSTNSQFRSLFIRNTSNQFDEVFLYFVPTFQTTNPGAGRLSFGYNLSSTFDYQVQSDANQWEEGIWYHVAGVIDPVEGIMLFINGVKQQETNPSTTATNTSIQSSRIGGWGGFSTRNFNGYIDDVRVSSIARYSSNFTPPCPSLINDTATIALWNFESGAGTVAYDSSSNGSNGTIQSATWANVFNCRAVGTKPLISKGEISVYPNPAAEIVNILVPGNSSRGFSIQIYDYLGRRVWSETQYASPHFQVRTRHLKGLYYVHILQGNDLLFSEKLILLGGG